MDNRAGVHQLRRIIVDDTAMKSDPTVATRVPRSTTAPDQRVHSYRAVHFAHGVCPNPCSRKASR